MRKRNPYTEKEKQGIAIALSLPEKDPTGVREKVFNEITLDKLNKTDGVETLMTYLDSLFKKDELSEVYPGDFASSDHRGTR